MLREPEVQPKNKERMITGSDATATFEQICEENGFSSTSHDVTTFDSYVLTMFRIQKKGVAPTKGAVLLQHGLFSDATAWVLNGADSPAF